MTRLLLVCGVLVATAFLALAPGTYSPLAPLADDWIPALDHRHLVVAAHLLGYAGLVVLLTWLTRRLARAVVAVLIFSSTLELIQVWLPWREGSWEDLAVNLLAVALGALLVWVAELGGLAVRTPSPRPSPTRGEGGKNPLSPAFCLL